MQTEKAKKTVMLALDMCGMRGRFTKRDVAEEAAKLVKWDSLSLTDQRDALLMYLSREAGNQMKAPIRSEISEQYLAKVPPKAWPVLEKINKTICVSPEGGRSAYYVLTLYASEEDWQNFLSVADAIERKATSARNAGQDAINLLRANGVSSLYELLTGKKIERQPFPKSAA